MRKFAAIALALSVLTVSASAQDAEKEFFRGKTVRIVVGSGTGGGYDIYARLIAPYLSRVLNATAVVENQPGAGGIRALNRLNISPADGLTMMFANGTSAAFAQLTDQPGLRFDLVKFGFLATVGAPPGLWLVAANSPYRSVQQALAAKKKWNWAASGPADGLGNGAAFTCRALKMQCQIVQGYKGSNEAALAVSRGEMDAIYIPESSANNFVKAKQNYALATMGKIKSRWFMDRPTIYEEVQLDTDGRWLMDFYSGIENMGRIMIVPPNMPAVRLAYLQAVMKEVLHNPKLIAEGERTERIIEYRDPQTTFNNAKAVLSDITADQKKRIKDIVARR